MSKIRDFIKEDAKAKFRGSAGNVNRDFRCIRNRSAL